MEIYEEKISLLTNGKFVTAIAIIIAATIFFISLWLDLKPQTSQVYLNGKQVPIVTSSLNK